jgi:hypothetical protein
MRPLFRTAPLATLRALTAAAQAVPVLPTGASE